MAGEVGLYCRPMPEPFGRKLRLTLFLAWLFYQGTVSRIIFGPLMPEIQVDLDLDHPQAGYLFLMIGVGYLVAPAFPVLSRPGFYDRLIYRNDGRQGWTKVVYVLNTWVGVTVNH